MSTSPSLTANWNFDTPKNRAAWDAATHPSSYFAPTVTYGDNNNIDDAATYNDQLRGHQSPGLDSDDLEDTTTLRDVEDAMSSFLDPRPARLSEDSTGGPPVLENGSGRVGRQLPLPSIHTTGEEMSIAGKSAGNTPYPNATILFESGDDEDDDIKCGRCKNPIAYCHCSPTMLPPRIDIDKEDVDKETPVSPAETANNESWLVEVCVSRRMEGETNHGGRVQAHHRRMYAPGTPQRPVRHSLSPTPEGFVHNRRLNYVPFHIPTTNR
jgi:hypothetical protein